MTVYAAPGQPASPVIYPSRYENFIGGKWVPPVQGRYFENISPVNGQPFIEIAHQPPSLKDVVRRNVVRLSVSEAANVRQPTLIIISAIDNLMKGAAGQAVQNANLLLGLSEQSGLPA